MKKYSYLLLIILFAVGLTACQSTGPSVEELTSDETETNDKVGVQELTGTVVVSDPYVFLKTAEGDVEIESYTVDFSDYEGQEIRVSGQYSGDTLFVDAIE